MLKVINGIDFRLSWGLINFKVWDTVWTTDEATYNVSKKDLKILSKFEIRKVKYFIEVSKTETPEKEAIKEETKTKDFLEYVEIFWKEPAKNIANNNKKLAELNKAGKAKGKDIK